MNRKIELMTKTVLHRETRMRMVWTGLALVFSLSTGAGADENSKENAIAIKAGKIITITGKEISPGIILIRDGKIEAVGKNVKIPWDAGVIDASDKVVMPGWIEAHTSKGLDRGNENVASVPYVSVFDSINPAAPFFEDSLRQGITTLHVSPGNSTLIGGRGMAVHPVGVTVEEMAVARDLFMKISLKPKSGQSRMAHLAALRKEFSTILRYMADLKEKREVKASGDKGKKPDLELDIKREAMANLLQGKMWALVYCPDASSVLRAIDLSRQFKFKMKLVVGHDAWKAAKEIAAAKLEVILDPSLVYWETDEEKHDEVLRIAPIAFWKAGVKFAFQTDPSRFGTSYMWYQAATAVKYGLPREEALKAGTIYPARILGLADRMGSIEKGKAADLVILTGDPLDTMTWVDTVLVGGRVVYERSKDEKLKRILDLVK